MHISITPAILMERSGHNYPRIQPWAWSPDLTRDHRFLRKLHLKRLIWIWSPTLETSRSYTFSLPTQTSLSREYEWGLAPAVSSGLVLSEELRPQDAAWLNNPVNGEQWQTDFMNKEREWFSDMCCQGPSQCLLAEWTDYYSSWDAQGQKKYFENMQFHFCLLLQISDEWKTRYAI